MTKQEPVGWHEINELFGNNITAHLRGSKVVLKRTLNGGFLIPAANGFIVLNECRHLLKKQAANNPICTEKNDKYDKREEQVVKCRHEAHDLDDEDNVDLFVNFRRTLDISSGNVIESSRSFAANFNTFNEIAASVNSPSKTDEQNETPLKIPDYINYCNYENFKSNLFTRDSNTVDKFREFMGPELKGYELCIPLVEPIYDKFLKGHKRFGYKYILRNMPEDKSLMDGQISQRQLRDYFRHIFRVVVPVELFGNQKNWDKIRKKVNKYFQTAFGEYFSARAVTNDLNMSAIEWLRVIEDENTKISIMSQLVESFFEKYIMAVLGTYIYTEKMTWSNEKIFFRINHWYHQTKKYIAQQIANGVYESIENEQFKHISPSNIPDARLTVHMKKNGFRPILIICPTPSQKREASFLNKLLYQMFLKKFEIVNAHKLENLWRNIHGTCSSNENGPLYFVTCDIHDAFGSINLQKLLDIIFAMMDELDDEVTLQSFAIFNPRFKAARYIHREYFDTPSLPLAFPARSLCCKNLSKPNSIMDKEWLKSRMQSYILHRKVLINEKLYYQMKGIGQGVPLTSLLCDIYYGTMLLEELGSFMKSGHLLRYVDDFLYFTQDKTSAERFLEQVHKGIAAYNCSFNAKKTSTNLPPYCANEFVYLGYRFNIKTFDVAPEFPKIPVRYSINLSSPDSTKALIIFTKRLASSLCLKVDKIVLDPSINSKKAIEKTIHQITTMAAKRCFAFLLSMADFNDIPGPQVFEIIKNNSVHPLCLQISKLQFPTTAVPGEHYKSLLKSTWQVYLKTFQGNTYLFKVLKSRIKFLLKQVCRTD